MLRIGKKKHDMEYAGIAKRKLGLLCGSLEIGATLENKWNVGTILELFRQCRFFNSFQHLSIVGNPLSWVHAQDLLKAMRKERDYPFDFDITLSTDTQCSYEDIWTLFRSGTLVFDEHFDLEECARFLHRLNLKSYRIVLLIDEKKVSHLSELKLKYIDEMINILYRKYGTRRKPEITSIVVIPTFSIANWMQGKYMAMDCKEIGERRKKYHKHTLQPLWKTWSQQKEMILKKKDDHGIWVDYLDHRIVPVHSGSPCRLGNVYFHLTKEKVYYPCPIVGGYLLGGIVKEDHRFSSGDWEEKYDTFPEKSLRGLWHGTDDRTIRYSCQHYNCDNVCLERFVEFNNEVDSLMERNFNILDF